MDDAKSKRQKLQSRLEALKNKRKNQWETTWREISSHMAPSRLFFDWKTKVDQEKGDRRDEEIINSKPVKNLSILVAGMMAGITSPAREWFKLTVDDEEVKKNDNVKQYLETCEKIISRFLQQSNWYTVLPNDTYPDLGAFGTSFIFIEEDKEKGIFFYPKLIGSYYLDTNSKGEVDTYFWRTPWEVRAIVDKFGLDNCSKGVQDCWRKQEFSQTFIVVHAVYPNADRIPDALGRDGMGWASCWFEEANPNREQFLREDGFYEFPGVGPRWSTSGSAAYGRGPGWDVLGDCKALQHREKRRAQMVDKIVNPPLKGTGDTPVDLTPGAFTQIPHGQEADIEPIVSIPPEALREIREEIAEISQRLDDGMYVNLWQATIDDERKERPTATEVEVRRNEVMLMLGPLLEALNTTLLEPCIKRVFSILDRAGHLPLPPQELTSDITVKFISILHHAQETAGAAGLQGLMNATLGLVQLDPNVSDKINTDVVVDELASMYGVANHVVRTDEEVQAMRDARAQKQQAQEDGQAALAATQGAKNLSGVDVGKLQDVAGALAPAAAAQAGTLPPP